MLGSEKVKHGVHKKLAADFASKVTAKQFNEVFLLLDSLRGIERTVPYRLFSDTGIYSYCSDGCLLKSWWDANTKGIEKDFNKGRKLMRLVKEIVSRQHSVLPYTLASELVFTTSLEVFLLNGVQEEVNELTEEVKSSLALFRDYLSSLLAIEILELDANKGEGLIACLLPVDNANAIDTTLQYYHSR